MAEQPEKLADDLPPAFARLEAKINRVLSHPGMEALAADTAERQRWEAYKRLSDACVGRGLVLGQDEPRKARARPAQPSRSPRNRRRTDPRRGANPAQTSARTPRGEHNPNRQESIMGVTFTFSLNQRVHHTDTGIDGKVDSLMVDRDGVQWPDFHYVYADMQIRRLWLRESGLGVLGSEAG